jgi:hypothetical protein
MSLVLIGRFQVEGDANFLRIRGLQGREAPAPDQIRYKLHGLSNSNALHGWSAARDTGFGGP